MDFVDITGGLGSLTISDSYELIGSSLLLSRGKKKIGSRQLPVRTGISKTSKNIHSFHRRIAKEQLLCGLVTLLDCVLITGGFGSFLIFRTKEPSFLVFFFFLGGGGGGGGGVGNGQLRVFQKHQRKTSTVFMQEPASQEQLWCGYLVFFNNRRSRFFKKIQNQRNISSEIFFRNIYPFLGMSGFY
jgi:hypothetical protein